MCVRFSNSRYDRKRIGHEPRTKIEQLNQSPAESKHKSRVDGKQLPGVDRLPAAAAPSPPADARLRHPIRAQWRREGRSPPENLYIKEEENDNYKRLDGRKGGRGKGRAWDRVVGEGVEGEGWEREWWWGKGGADVEVSPEYTVEQERGRQLGSVLHGCTSTRLAYFMMPFLFIARALFVMRVDTYLL